MKAKEMTKTNLESVLLDFRIEAGVPNPAILETYCRRYPKFARELTDYALEWLVDEAMAMAEPANNVSTNASSPIVSRAISRLYARIRERETGREAAARPSGQSASNPFQELPLPRKRAICTQLGINMPLLAKFQNRLIDPDSVPSTFLEPFARLLERTVEGFLGYLRLPAMANAAADFKAEGKPSVSGKKERFEEAVRGSSLDENQKQALLKG